MTDRNKNLSQTDISAQSAKMAPDLSSTESILCECCSASMLLGRQHICDCCLQKIKSRAAAITFDDDVALRRNLVRALMYEQSADSEPLFVLNDIGNRVVLILFASWINLSFSCTGRYPTIRKAKNIVCGLVASFGSNVQYNKTEALQLIDAEVREAFVVANACDERNIRYTNEVALINIKKLKPANFYVVTDPGTGFSYVVSQKTPEDDGRSTIKFKLIGGMEYMMSRFDFDDPANREICLTEDYYLAEMPTTQRQWGALNGQQVDSDKMQTNVSYADLFGSMDWPLFKPWNVSADRLGPALRTLSQNGIVLSLPTRAQLELVEETLPANSNDTFDHLELCMDWRDLESKEWEHWPLEREWRSDENVRTDPVGPFQGIRRTLMGYEETPKEKVFTAVGLGVCPCEKIGPLKELFGFRFCVPAVVEKYFLKFVVNTADEIRINCPEINDVDTNINGHRNIEKIVIPDNIPVIDPLSVGADWKSAEMRNEDDVMNVELSKSRPCKGGNDVCALENALIEKNIREHFSHQGVNAEVNIAPVEGYPCRRRCAIISNEDVDRIFAAFDSLFVDDMQTVWKPVETLDGECCAFEYVLPTASIQDKREMQTELEEICEAGVGRRFIVPEPSAGGDQAYAPLRYEFYDAIESGEKKVEYREYNASWAKKLLSRPMKTIKFSRGYGQAGDKPRQMVFEITNIGIVDANSEIEISSRREDGSPISEADVHDTFIPTHFAIHLGERLS